ELKFPTACHQCGEEGSYGFPAYHHVPITAVMDGIGLIAVKDGIGLKESSHSVDVSRPLAGNQETLQVLRITRWLVACFIGHDTTPASIANPISVGFFLRSARAAC